MTHSERTQAVFATLKVDHDTDWIRFYAANTKARRGYRGLSVQDGGCVVRGRALEIIAICMDSGQRTIKSTMAVNDMFQQDSQDGGA
jgi:hypothetical protein